MRNRLRALYDGLTNANSRLPIHIDLAHATVTGGGEDRCEAADAALEYLTVVALCWLHGRRRTDAGKALLAGFPTPPTADELAFDPPLTVAAKAPTPPPQPHNVSGLPLAQLVTVAVGPRDGVIDTGVDVSPLDDIEITATGSINSGIFLSGPSGPDGWNQVTDNGNYPLANDTTGRYSLLGRMGEHGAYFRVGTTFPRRCWYFDSPARLFLTINTDNHDIGSGQFQVVVKRWAPVTRSGRPWHAIRHADGSWDRLASVAEQEANDPGPFDVLACSGTDDAPQLHVVGLVDGHPWHTVRAYDGRWQPQYGDVLGQVTAPPSGRLTAISCAACNSPWVGLQVVGVASGKLWLAVRSSDDGSWTGFTSVEDHQEGKPGPFTEVACAAVAGELHIVGIVGGALVHTIRYSPQAGPVTWQSGFGEIADTTAGNPGAFTSVSCAFVGGSDLHVVGIVDGRLQHTIRKPDGSWQPFGVIGAQERNDPGPFSEVACAGLRTPVAPTLHVAGVAMSGVWHTIRNDDGAWQDRFGDVGAAAGYPGPCRSLGTGGIGQELHIVELL